MNKYYVEVPVKKSLEENLNKLHTNFAFISAGEDNRIPNGTFCLYTTLEKNELEKVLPDDFADSVVMELPVNIAYDIKARLRAMIDENGNRCCVFQIK